MKVRVPVLIKDQVTWREYFPEVQPEYETFLIKKEEFFLDGPVTSRVAVLDFDPKTGAPAHPPRCRLNLPGFLSRRPGR